jgi:hypothetical protein
MCQIMKNIRLNPSHPRVQPAWKKNLVDLSAAAGSHGHDHKISEVVYAVFRFVLL